MKSDDALTRAADEAARAALIRELRATNGSVRRAAKLLGIGRPNLYHRARRLCVDINSVRAELAAVPR